MGLFGKKKDEAQQTDAPAEGADDAKAKHDADHVDKNGAPKAEKVGEVCEFC